MAENGADQLGAEKPPLFAQINFHIILSEKLNDTEANTISQSLSEQGGVEIARTSTSGDIDLAGVSHIISATSDFSKYSAAEAVASIAIVMPQWVRDSLRTSRLANVRKYTPDPRKYFSGLVVTTADLPEGDKDAIYAGVIQLGGQTSSSVTRLITHIVALSLDSDKCQVAKAKGLSCKFVLPHWFDDCLKLGQRIDETPYLLTESAEPEILGAMRKSTKECVKELDPTHLEGASTALPNPRQLPTPSMSPTSSIRKMSVFKNKHVMLSYDLDISSHLRKTLDELIVAAGGTLTGSIHKADTYICQYREGNDYMTAYENAREIGNLAWLYYLITHGTWTSPLRRLLHYPIAREGLQDFKDFKICLSNFNGDARIYLENLARAIGSEFTKTMTQENTHLITAHTVSEKCQAAREWGVNVVNHLWLEESYAKWQAQTLTNPRYTHFPARTNLSQVVGQTPIDKKALPKSFKMGEGAEDRQTPKPLPRTNKLSAKLPTSSDQRPTQSSPTRQAGALQSLGPDVGTPQAFKEKRRHSDNNGLKTPASRGLTGKENETPSSTASRKAKEIAVTKVQDAANDMNAYQKETRRVGGVTHGGRRSADEIVNDPNPSRKRTKSAEEERGAEPAKEERATKKAKNSKGPPTIHLLLSGYQKWVDNPKQEGVDRAILRAMNVMIVQQSSECTHVAAPRIIRTQKFITAIANGAVVISTEFVEKCLESSKRPDPDKYPLKDKQGEHQLGCTLSVVRERALANKGRLLKGYHLFSTETNFDIYKAICEANGGKCLLFKGRSQSLAVTSRATDDDDSETERDEDPERQGMVYLVSSAEAEDKKLWPKFRSMALDAKKTPRIVKNDWLTAALLRQKVEWSEVYRQEGSSVG